MPDFKKLNEKDIPQIDLYMDQVITILEQRLESYKINPDEKIMTKAMVNNYVKSKLLSKPVKKKYNKDQIMQLTMIYHLKSILTFTELDAFFQTAMDRDHNSVEDLYYDFLEVHNDALEEAKRTKEQFAHIDEEHQIKELMKIILTADLNKRIAQEILKNLKESANHVLDEKG